MKPSPHLLARLSLLLLAAPSLRAFDAADDFTDYATPAKFSSRAMTDVGGAGFPGTGASGNGWLTGWRSASTGVVAAANVINTSPLSFGGNYLAATLSANPAATGIVDAIAIGRAYDLAGAALPRAAIISIGFDFRVDNIGADTMRPDLFESAVRASSSTAKASSYCFRVVDGYWRYYDGVNLESTGMTFKAGTAYAFAITLDPSAFSYSFTLSDGTSTVAIHDAAFRARAFDTDTNAGSIGARWIQFGAAETTDVVGQAATLSIDNLFIAVKNGPVLASPR